ncbi:hypothetical protein [Nocardia sp. NPDC057030]|uniref:hypothetical protein n=1 Tax=unclassified Nocardia TaxID=2637762 RepID=UPI00363A70B4
MTPPLPEAELVLAACRGLTTIIENPLLEAAGELAELHRIRECTPWSQTIEDQRARLRYQIDLWVEVSTPIPDPAARIHTQTVGAVVDQLAQLTMEAFVALAHAPSPVFYDAQMRLGELSKGYQDLIDDLAEGKRRVPSVAAVLKPP